MDWRDPMAAPPLMQEELTEDGAPTPKFQKSFALIGSSYRNPTSTNDALLSFQLDSFLVPYRALNTPSISTAKLKEYQRNGKIPYFISVSLWHATPESLQNHRVTQIYSGAEVCFVILDKEGKVVVKESVPLEDASFSYVTNHNGYMGELPRAGHYKLILWAKTKAGITFGGTRETYLVLPSPEEEEEEDDEYDEYEPHDECDAHIASPFFVTLLRNLLWLCEPLPVKVLRGCLWLVQSSSDFQPLAEEHHQQLEVAAIFDAAAVSERVKQENQTETRVPATRNKSEMVRIYLSLLERYQESQKLETDKEGYTHLMCAAEFGYLDVVEVLIAAGVEVNERNTFGATALMHASRRGHLDVVKALIAAGADINAVGNYGIAALSWAISFGHLDVVKELIAAGADIELKIGAWRDSTALIVAATARDANITKELLAAGANINAKNHDNYTAFLSAVVSGEIKTAELLLAAGADINVQNKEGSTALMIVSYGNNADFAPKATMLIAAGAKLDLQDKEGKTALMHAVTARNKGDLIKALLEAGANTEIRDNRGWTALMAAVDENEFEVHKIVKELLSAGADVNAKDKEGRTALQCALEAQRWIRIEVVEVLVSAGADLDVRDDKGLTALECVERLETTPPCMRERGKVNAADRGKLIELLRKAKEKEEGI